MHQFQFCYKTIVQLPPLCPTLEQPVPDGHFPHTEYFLYCGGIYTQGQQPWNLLYFLRMTFQPIQDGIPPDRELTLTCLAFEILDFLIQSMCAIPYQCMCLLIAYPVIFAAFVRTKISCCTYLLLRPALPFAQLPGYRCFTLWVLSFCPFPLSSWQNRQSRSLFGRRTAGFRSGLFFFFCISRWCSQIWRTFR